MADQGGAQAAAEAVAEAARVAELGRQLYEASVRGQAAEVARIFQRGGGGFAVDAAHGCC